MTKLNCLIIASAEGSRPIQAAVQRLSNPAWAVVNIQQTGDWRTALLTSKPDVVFLDADYCTEALDFARRLQPLDFQLVVLADSKEFAFAALQATAFQYLIKPLKTGDLELTISKIKQYRERRQWERMEDVLRQVREFNSIPPKVAFPTDKGLRLISPDDIIYCRSDNNYTHVVMTTGERLLVSQTLKRYESQLARFGFMRTHQSFLINPRHIVSINRGKIGMLTMSNQERAEVAGSQRAMVSEWVRKNLRYDTA
ncbi:MAG: LytTR family DNA-binding domain-containing protein [Chitinophagales bacterium]